MRNSQILCSVLCVAHQAGAFAHEGHGMLGASHWHISDALGIIGFVAVAALAWFIKNKK